MKKEYERFEEGTLFEGLVSLRVLIGNYERDPKIYGPPRRIRTVFYDRERAKKEQKEYRWLMHRAEALGFDIIGTTLYGYTKEPIPMPAPNFDMMRRLAADLKKPVIAEGGIFSPEQLRTAMDQGVHACVVGSAA